MISSIGHHHEFQCGHNVCELCLLVTEECSTVCSACEVSFIIFHIEHYNLMLKVKMLEKQNIILVKNFLVAFLQLNL